MTKSVSEWEKGTCIEQNLNRTECFNKLMKKIILSSKPLRPDRFICKIFRKCFTIKYTYIKLKSDFLLKWQKFFGLLICS